MLKYFWKQESPPAWTQEAYRPWRIKYYSVGVPVHGQVRLGGGVPRWGTPLARSNGGYLRWSTPHQGTPLPGLIGGYPCQGTPHLDLAGVPPLPGPGRGTPPPGPGQGTPPSWTWPGYPPRCGQTDRRMSKHNLPSYYGVVSMRLLLDLDCFCLPNIVTEDILRHKILLPRTFSTRSKLLPSTFSATSKLLLSTFVATNKFNFCHESTRQQLACCRGSSR